MYREEDYEMEQLLRSIHDVDNNAAKTKRHYESHILFDGGVRGQVIADYALQLASLVEETLKVQLSDCCKIMTPYGMQLKWSLPGGMEFTIHLKDNAKVSKPAMQQQFANIDSLRSPCFSHPTPSLCPSKISAH